MHKNLYFEYLKERDKLKALGLDGKAMIKLILNTLSWDMKRIRQV
jgi:hypothetical protein